ncbi:hypothetical protein FACS1894103_6880 [Campylobacterota bacterium]|nr:hypothetical protein FACS1894103_6880 [Campylobacterota bacterium]
MSAATIGTEKIEMPEDVARWIIDRRIGSKAIQLSRGGRGSVAAVMNPATRDKEVTRQLKETHKIAVEIARQVLKAK